MDSGCRQQKWWNLAFIEKKIMMSYALLYSGFNIKKKGYSHGSLHWQDARAKCLIIASLVIYREEIQVLFDKKDLWYASSMFPSIMVSYYSPW